MQVFQTKQKKWNYSALQENKTDGGLLSENIQLHFACFWVTDA